MASWLEPYKDKNSREFIKLLAQILFGGFALLLGASLMFYGFQNNNNTAITMGSGFAGTAIGTWVGSQ
jgi:hypothetical protein